MKRMVTFIVVTLAAVVGCSRPAKQAIVIGDIKMTVEEFEQAYAVSPFATKRPSDRQAFLESLITQKLILREAETSGMDRDPEFLQEIQRYWSQGLLRLMLAEKNDMFARQITVSDEEIAQYYAQYKDTFFPNRSLEQMSGEIRNILRKEKLNQEMLAWLQGLRDQTDIVVDYQRLGISQPEEASDEHP